MQAPRSPLGGHAGRCRREWIFEMGCTSRPARDLYAAIPPGGWHKPLLCYSATPPLHYSITPLAPSKLMPRRCDGLLTDINTRLGKDRSMMCGCGPSDLQAISNCSSPIPHPWRSCRDRSSASDPLPERRLVPVLEVLHAIPILMARHRPLCEMSQLGSLERCGVSGAAWAGMGVKGGAQSRLDSRSVTSSSDSPCELGVLGMRNLCWG